MDFTNKKILVIGDIILDAYVEGGVYRLSPEAPIPILYKKKEYYRLGGATNVAKNLASLGAKVWIIGRIGKDSEGCIIQNLLDTYSINVDLLLKDGHIPTTKKTRFLSDNHQLLRVDFEDTTSIKENPEFVKILDADLDRHVKYFDAVIISDYNKGVVFPEMLQHIGCLKKKYNTIITADTKHTNWDLFEGFTCITPNLKEFQKQCPPLTDMSAIKKYGEETRRKHKLEQLLVTLSENGLYLFTEASNTHFPVVKKDIVDVTGCGDTVIAVYTLALSSGMSPEDSALMANKAAGIVISKLGTAIVTPEELKD